LISGREATVFKVSKLTVTTCPMTLTDFTSTPKAQIKFPARHILKRRQRTAGVQDACKLARGGSLLAGTQPAGRIFVRVCDRRPALIK
jgi:hypothetical protein